MARRRRQWGSFPTTADEGIWATADTPAGLFEALGLGLFALRTDLRTVRAREERIVHASGSDLPALVVAWLGELLVLQQTEGFLAREASVPARREPPTALLATVGGEPFDPKRHPLRTEVKAITFHRLEFDTRRGRARVIVDI